MGVIVGLLCALNVGAQTTPVAAYTDLGNIGSVVSEVDDAVCPSFLPTYPSDKTYRIDASLNADGELSENEFEWIVYGGQIISYSGTVLVPLSTELFEGHNFSEVRTRDTEGNYSWITVRWDQGDHASAWIAVRQSSEWNCTDGAWSVFTQEVFNPAPTFLSNFPSNIHIPYDRRSNFVLPDPSTFSEDLSCPDGAILSYSYVVDRPAPLSDLSGDNNNLTLTDDLGLGANVVTWTVSDGVKQVVGSYTITVEPALAIIHVAWSNPFCATGGMAMVTQRTNDPANPFTWPVEYSFDGGAYGVSPSATGLTAGAHTLQARMVYTVDIDNDGTNDVITQYSEEYSFTLTAMAATAVNDVPAEGEGSVVVPTSCLSTPDGEISVGAMSSNNASVAFNGSSYLMLNKNFARNDLEAFSIAAWIRTASASGTILSFDNSVYFHLGLSGGQVQLTTRSSANDFNSVTVVDANLRVNDNRWHQVVATYGSGVYRIYVDGVPAATQAAVGTTSLGNGSVRYGIIGALSTADELTDAPAGSYFNGNIAEVALWDNSSIAPENVPGMFPNGISSVGGMSDHWVLNNVPLNVSGAFPGVFTDLYDLAADNNFARMYQTTRANNNAPILYSWSDDPEVGTPDRKNLDAETDYILTVTDIFACGEVPETFRVPNGDENEPLILWNVSPGKTALQSDASNDTQASDGLYSTASVNADNTEPWWDLPLSGNYMGNIIRVTSVNALTNAYVILSPSAITAATLAEYLLIPGVQYKQITIGAGATGEVTFTTSGRYVRIWSSENSQLSLNEVEVLTQTRPVLIRELFIDSDCEYLVSADDAAIDPVPYDACGAKPDLIGVCPDINGGDPFESLIDFDLPVGLYTVTWTATDDNDLESEITITYDVLDRQAPEFLPGFSDPFAGVPDKMTSCMARTFRFPIPRVSDNYVHCTDGQLNSIILSRDGGWGPAFNYVDSINKYDPGVPQLTPAMPAVMSPGTWNFTWEITDHTGVNRLTVSKQIEIEVQPRIREVRMSPNTCFGSTDGVVYISKYDAAVNPTSISFILKSIAEPYTEYPFPTPVIAASDLPAGTYQAFIEVNGCRSSDPYPFDIVLRTINEITTVNNVSNIICYGETNGSIAISPQGGSQINVLHLIGATLANPTPTFASAGGYAALDAVAATGMIEAWFFLDTLGLSTGTVNYDAGIFGRPNGGTGYGLRMVNGQLQLYVGGETTAGLPVAQRTWVYARGTWNGSGASRFLTLELSNGGSSTVNPGSDFTASSGGNVFFGSMGDGDDTYNLRGFVRNARIWNAVPDAATLSSIMYMTTPLDPGSNLVANYPINAAGTSTITNSVSGGVAGTINGVANVTYARQRFAYYWTDPDGNYLSNLQNVSSLGAGDYTVTLYDPMGCSPIAIVIPVITDDQISPTLWFYSDYNRSQALGVGEYIVRYTSYENWNGTGWDDTVVDCAYVPSNHEFDPKVTDGSCSPDYVTVTWELVAGSDDFLNPGAIPVDPANSNSLDPEFDPLFPDVLPLQMTGIQTIRWTARDRNINNPPTVMDVTYYIVDDEAPVDGDLDLADVTVNVDATCKYTVPPGAHIPTNADNCGTGVLSNDINGLDNLDGVIFDVGVHQIEWTYTDRTFYGVLDNPPSISFTHTLTVVDNTPPVADCKPVLPEFYLDDAGSVTITTADIDRLSRDNCSGSSPVLRVTRNIAHGLGAAWVTQSSEVAGATLAADNNIDDAFANGSVSLTSAEVAPWWQVNLNGIKTLFAVNVYASDVAAAPLNNFWVLVSNDGNFPYTGDLSNPDWDESSVTYAEYYDGGAISGNLPFEFSRAVSGSHVRIWMTPAADQALALAEVEVYGAATPSGAVDFECIDVRYSPNADPRTGGAYGTTGILLTAIDPSGNISSCLSQVELLDDIFPTVATVTLDVSPDANGIIAFDPWVLATGSDDNCEIADIWTNDVLDCENMGSQNITLNVMDEFGNTTSELVTINVKDNVKPIARAKANVIIELDDQGVFTITNPRAFLEGAIPSEISTDNCPNNIVSAEVTPNSFVCAQVPLTDPIVLTYTVRDGSNNVSDPITILADVQDNRPPIASIQNFDLRLNKTGKSIIYVNDFNAGVYDNCGIDWIGICYDVLDLDNLCYEGTEDGGAANDCREWTCADVGNHTAYIVYQPSSGGAPLVVSKSFQVLPYFTIDDVQLKDCAVSGEQYWSWVTNAPDDVRYCWQQQNYSLVNGTYTYINSNGNTVTGYITNSMDVLQNRNSGSSTASTDALYAARGAQICYTDVSSAYVRVSRDIADGTYTIRLTVTDMSAGNSGCTASFDRTFDWEMDWGGGANTDKTWEYCKDALVPRRFDLDLVVPNSYYGCFRGIENAATCNTRKPLSYNWFNNWDTKTWADNAGMQRISGGGAYDKYIDVLFPVASATPYNVWGEVGGSQRYVYYGSDNFQSDAPTMYVPPAGSTTNCTNGCYDFGANFIGPFNLDDATLIDNSTIPQLVPNSTTPVNMETGTYPISRCYDENNVTYSRTTTGGVINASITYNYTNPINVRAIKLYWYDNGNNNNGQPDQPATATVQFSTDGVVWSAAINVDRTANRLLHISITSPANIRYVRLNFRTANNKRVAVSEFRVYEHDYLNYDISGKNVVRPYTDSNYAPCNEGVKNIVTIREVEVPVITGTTTNICPFQQVTYTLPEPTPDPDPANLTYANYNWTITGGRKVSGGGGNDNTVTVEWNMSGWPTTTPKIALEVTNYLGCTEADSWNVTYDQTEGIEVTCPPNASYDAIVGTCEYLYLSTSKATVTMPNGCPYDTLVCSTDGGATWKANAANTTFQLGENEIIWRAYDYFWTEADPDGHYDECIQTITIVDNEQPRFTGATLSNVTLDTPDTDLTSTTCTVDFPAGLRDATAADGGNCTPADELVFVYSVDLGNDDALEADWDFVEAAGNTVAGITFPLGESRVKYTVRDNALNARNAYFTVTVRDRTKPQILSGIDDILNAVTNIDDDSATVVIVTPAGNYNFIDPPSGGNLWDNCSDAAALTVTGVRDDGLALNAKYPRGDTEITWTVRDAANQSNSYIQLIRVSDNQDPEFTDNNDFFANASVAYQNNITHCQRLNYRIPIPRSYWDNIRVEYLNYNVTNSNDDIILTGQLSRAASANFTVGGQPLLAAYAFSDNPADPNYVDPVNGSNFTVYWTATDNSGNRSDSTVNHTYYTLRVEVQPRYTETVPVQMSCADGGTATLSVLGSVYEVESTPYYSINNGQSWQTENVFNITSSGEYTVLMRVNGCLAPERMSESFTVPDQYQVSIASYSNLICPEKAEGTISIKMIGGAPSQLVFTGGSSYSADHYDNLNLAATGGAIEAWIYLHALGDVPLIVGKTDAYWLSLTGGKFALNAGTGQIISTFTPVINRWYHVSGSWDSGTMSITIDGSNTDSESAGGYTSPDYGNQVIIGGAGFRGMIREVRVWNTTVSGGYPGTPFTGYEPNLVAYWDLGEGASPVANRCYASSGGLATPANGGNLWVIEQPQPGIYTWERTVDGSTSTYNTSGMSNIFLTELPLGTFTLTFADTYGCEAKAPAFQELIATDNELPVIDYSRISTDMVANTPLLCYALLGVSDRDSVNLYTPEIVDASGCNFDITWKVVVSHSGELLTRTETYYDATSDYDADLNKIYGAKLGRDGTNGVNTVYISLAQNGMESDPEDNQYIITLNDVEPPTPRGRFDGSISSMNLDENGVVEYFASDFNLNSGDNCSDVDELTFKLSIDGGVTWQNSIFFDCEDIGQDVNIMFMAIDQGIDDDDDDGDGFNDGNHAEEINAIPDLQVRDVTKPITGETSDQNGGTFCATTNAVIGVSPAFTDDQVKLSEFQLNNYSDNCGVTRIRYRIHHTPPAAYPGFTGGNTNWVEIIDADPMTELIDFPEDNLTMYEGINTIEFELADGSDELEDAGFSRNTVVQTIYVVTILPKPVPGSSID